MTQNKLEKSYQEALTKIKGGKRVPLLRVIRLKCADCVCWQENEIRLCPADDCILWDFRMGKNPIKRVMSEKQKANLQKLHAKH
jgi:hypothetical protein